jgi:hypothetical protein
MAFNIPLGTAKAALNVPHLIDVAPTPPPGGPIPVPYPNAHLDADTPSFLVLDNLFGQTEIDAIGPTPPIDHWLI